MSAAGSVGGGPCDPDYANFAAININVAGQDVHTVYDGNVQGKEFVGTAALAPEPATLGIFAGSALPLGAFARKGKRFLKGQSQKTLAPKQD